MMTLSGVNKESVSGRQLKLDVNHPNRSFMDITKKSTILIVDDEPSNLAVLSGLLASGYRVLACKSGQQALQIAPRDPRPDLILLDIMMPGMDGYEVLKLLREEESTRDIPVIFLTALDSSEDEEKGLDLGAVDYIAKPYSPAIVKARIRNTLDLKRHRDYLAALVAERTRELTEANNRLKAIDEAQVGYLHAISHELRTPMNGILGVAELALDELGEEQRSLYMEIYRESRNRVMTALDSALRLAELQGESPSVETIPVDLGTTVSYALGNLETAFSEKNISVQFASCEPGLVLADEAFLQQTIDTLLKTILRMAASGTDLSLKYNQDPERVLLRMVFQSPSFPEKLKSTLFQPFSYDRSSSVLEDLGLSVPLAAHIVQAMGGRVELCESGSAMELKLALLRPNAPQKDIETHG
jgi:CheY-like chemotaxis protein